MKALHFIKTSDGARWACEMVEQLVKTGVEVTVVLPSPEGKMIDAWKRTGADLIFAYSEMPVRKMWKYLKVKKEVKSIIDKVKPDIIHAHFFSQIILLRNIDFNKLRIFQVPGPLHLENKIFKYWDLYSAKSNDKWIASSRYILDLYKKENINKKKLGLSYYGNHLEAYTIKNQNLKEKYNLTLEKFVVGNLSYFYAPKAYLFQRLGLKGHELFISILDKCKMKGIIFGQQFGVRQDYYEKVKKQSSDNIIFAGGVEPFQVSKAWNTMDICLHLPLSENCGGVVEPLLHEVPVICCKTGGLPEVIIDEKTGILVNRNEAEIQKALLFAKENPELMIKYAQNGQMLVLEMFDVKRTALEIYEYYQNVNDFSTVKQFNSKEFSYD